MYWSIHALDLLGYELNEREVQRYVHRALQGTHCFTAASLLSVIVNHLVVVLVAGLDRCVSRTSFCPLVDMLSCPTLLQAMQQSVRCVLLAPKRHMMSSTGAAPPPSPVLTIGRQSMYSWLLTLRTPEGAFLMHEDGEIDVRCGPLFATATALLI